MSELQGVARQKVQASRVEEFKQLAAQCMEIVRTKDIGTLQYEVYVDDDESEFIVLERFKDSAALIQHSANLGKLGEKIFAIASTSGELLGAPSTELREKLAGSPVRLFKPFLSSERVEGRPKTGDMEAQTAFVYTIYVMASPERVWQGLTDPDLMRGYWRHQKAGPKTFLSDWKKGSTYDMAHGRVGLVVSDPDQVILESDPYDRLAYTWHTMTSAWAAAVGMDEATAALWRAEPRSKVAFDIADVGHGTTKLTVTHDGFAPGSAVLHAISEGWPAVLSSLKTLLETGSS